MGSESNKNIKYRKYKELCLSGAANRGISYIGALQCLQENDLLDIKKFVGVSIGSLIGFMYIAGMDPITMMEHIIEQNMEDFQDFSMDHIINEGSILRGEKFRLWVLKLLTKVVDPMISFSSMYKKNGIEINIVAVSLDSGEDGLEIFNHLNTPNMPIYYAIVASMTVPFVFPPFVYNNKRYIDGGLLNNFPMDLLSKDAIGIEVSSKEFEADLTNVTYFLKLTSLAAARIKKLTKCEGTVITINASDFLKISFDSSVDSKVTLYNRGYNATLEFIKSLKPVKEPVKEPIKEPIKELVKEESIEESAETVNS